VAITPPSRGIVLPSERLSRYGPSSRTGAQACRMNRKTGAENQACWYAWKRAWDPLTTWRNPGIADHRRGPAGLATNSLRLDTTVRRPSERHRQQRTARPACAPARRHRRTSSAGIVVIRGPKASADPGWMGLDRAERCRRTAPHSRQLGLPARSAAEHWRPVSVSARRSRSGIRSWKGVPAAPVNRAASRSPITWTASNHPRAPLLPLARNWVMA